MSSPARTGVLIYAKHLDKVSSFYEQVLGAKVLHALRTGHDHTQIFEAVLLPQLLAARVPELLGLAEGSPAYDLYTKNCPTKYNNGR